MRVSHPHRGLSDLALAHLTGEWGCHALYTEGPLSSLLRLLLCEPSGRHSISWHLAHPPEGLLPQCRWGADHVGLPPDRLACRSLSWRPPALGGSRGRRTPSWRDRAPGCSEPGC